MSKDLNRKKRAVLITVDKEMHFWAKENIKNFSGFVEKALEEFSGSFAAADSKKD